MPGMRSRSSGSPRACARWSRSGPRTTARGALRGVRKAMRLLGISAIDWLSPSALERFNREIPDVTGVRYACVVGGIRSETTGVPLALSPVHHYLRRVSGANDGLVPVASQV